MIKKWRPFWSYDIDKTEAWLTDMAEKGYQLESLNKTTRTFSFKEKKSDITEHQISYNKNKQPLDWDRFNNRHNDMDSL